MTEELYEGKHTIPMVRVVTEDDIDIREPNPIKPSPSDKIADTVISWMVKYDLLDAGNEYQAEDVLAVLEGFVPRCRDCDGYNCDDGCAYPDGEKR